MQALDRLEGRVTGVLLDDGVRPPARRGAAGDRHATTSNGCAGKRGCGTDRGLLCDATLHAVGSDVVVGAGDVAHASTYCSPTRRRASSTGRDTRDQADLAAADLLCGRALARPLLELPMFGTTIHGARHPPHRVRPGRRDQQGHLGLPVEEREALIALVAAEGHRRGSSMRTTCCPGSRPLLRPGLSVGPPGGRGPALGLGGGRRPLTHPSPRAQDG